MPSVQPPRYPTDLGEIHEAAALCAKFARGSGEWQATRDRDWARLSELCGRLPRNRREATAWKLWLRALWREAGRESDHGQG